MLQITSECYKKPGDNASVENHHNFIMIFLVENHHNLRAQMEHFLHRLKLYPRGGLKEIHSLVRDGTDRKQVYAYKTKPTNAK